MAENRELVMAKDSLEEKLTIAQEKIGKERRSLMEDNVEMQRRLDELTPLLAEKEAKIAKLEKDRDAASTQLKKANLQLHSLQVCTGYAWFRYSLLNFRLASRRGKEKNHSIPNSILTVA